MSGRPREFLRKGKCHERRSSRRALGLVTSFVVLAGLSAPEARAQGGPQLSVTRIWNQGPLKVGGNTFRATVKNSSQTHGLTGAVDVRLEVLDGDQSRRTYKARVSNLGPNGDQSVAFRNVDLPRPGAYTVTATADPDGRFDRFPADNSRTEVFEVRGEAAGGGGGAHRLVVTVKNGRGQTVNGLRVSLKSADGQEVSWKNSAGTGQAQFPKVAAPQSYLIEVKRAAQLLGRFDFEMPAQDAVFTAEVE